MMTSYTVILIDNLGADPDTDEAPIYVDDTDDDEPILNVLSIDGVVWRDLGSPQRIRMTIEPLQRMEMIS